MDGPKKKQQKLDWEDEDFSTREVRGYSHHKSYTRRDIGDFSEEEVHVSVRWLKKAVEKFYETGSETFKNRYMDLKLLLLLAILLALNSYFFRNRLHIRCVTELLLNTLR